MARHIPRPLSAIQYTTTLAKNEVATLETTQPRFSVPKMHRCRQRGQQTFFRQFLRVNRRLCSAFFAFRRSLNPVFPRAPRLSVAVYWVRHRCSTYSGLARRLSLRKWSKLGWSASNISNPTEISGDGFHLRLQWKEKFIIPATRRHCVVRLIFTSVSLHFRLQFSRRMSENARLGA